jgi:Barrel-sandwich domain of CusB or HlyD membrane-fusion
MNEQNNGAAVRPRQPAELIDALLKLLAAPRQPDFYADYADLVQALCRTEAAMVVDASGLDMGAPAEQAPRLGSAGSAEDLQALAAQFTTARWQASGAQGYSHELYRKNDGLGAVMLLVRLLDAAPHALLLSLPERDRAHLKEALVRALLVKDLRASAPQAQAVSTLAAQPTGALLDMLGLATEVLQAPRFGAAALTLVNGAVRTLGLSQAVLCWRVAGVAQVLAISHIDKFEKTSRLVSALEAAATEVLSTDQVISLGQHQATPSAEDEGADQGYAAPARPPGHQALLDSLEGMHHVTSLPMRDGSGQAQAVLIAVSNNQPLPQDSVNQALLMLEMVYPRLADSRWRDANVFQRLRQSTLARLELYVGPGRPWLKFGTLFASVLLLVMLFVQVPYRVEASAQLITDSTRLLTSQNDGRLLDVLVDVGDTVKQGQPLAKLDTTDLQQQLAEVQSEIQRYASEEDKARAGGALAEMQVAQARRLQSEARLMRVAYFLQQARTEAPFEGVVVEGERRNLLGSSVKRGDKLFRIAQVRDLYVVLQVPEHAIRDLHSDAQAELLLLSQPDQPIRLKVSSFVPMAQVKGEEGNQFVLKAQILDPVAPWWRPGMTGLAKIDAGSRNISWVLFHRTIDKLRLWFWW